MKCQHLFAVSVCSLSLFLSSVFDVKSQDTVTDVDGNIYTTVTIGSQTWLRQNLNVLHNPDGTPILNVYAYNNNPANAAIYGRLYFWDAAMNGSTAEKAQGICPDGWHVPSQGEWNALASHLGGWNTAGGKMKETGTAHWNAPNTGATNTSGFTALPAGEKDNTVFQLLHEYAVMWSSTQTSATWANYIYLSYEDATLHPYNYFKDFAYSVRCIRDEQTGMIEPDRPTISLFPNPLRNLTTLRSDRGMTTAAIINQTGSKVKEFQVPGTSARLDLGFLAPGIYVLLVHTEASVPVRITFIKN